MLDFIRSFVTFISVLILSSCINDDPTEGADLKVGDRIPDFSVNMNDGSTVTGESLRQGVSVIVFFHTGCPDCQVTLPEIQNIYNEYSGRGVKFALISRDERSGSIDAFWEKAGLDMPYSPQKGRDVYELFATITVPRVYICDDGIIKAIFTDNPNPKYEDMDAVLKGLI